MKALLAFFILMALSQIALAEQVPEAAQSLLDSFPSIGKLVVYLISLQIFLRGAAEALTRIAVTTEGKTDNKIAGWLAQAAWILGSMLGKFGYSVPKLVIEEKAKKINEIAIDEETK